MEYVYNGASIECESALLVSRDIKISGLIALDNVGSVIKYNCKRNSESKITRISTSVEPLHFKAAHRNLNDQIRAEDIVVFVSRKMKIGIVNYTGTHKAQTTETNCLTLAQITKPFPNLGIIKDPRQAPPSLKKP